ncbi:hypothetical protein EVG20_g1166 [Dentipellis fragilis]|uniref:DRBM domain-containing protein n=1 Tax=Dentipellis fragilis TaxID=205917 RepID=A0A4Y9ZAG5_9AGAM|nr:hypothetical protein EVG20_g1166 [Dentipellis fragilis]
MAKLRQNQQNLTSSSGWLGVIPAVLRATAVGLSLTAIPDSSAATPTAAELHIAAHIKTTRMSCSVDIRYFPPHISSSIIMSFQPSGDFILDLNNYLQQSGGTAYLSWRYSESGPPNQVTHYADVYYHDQLIGRGRATSRNGARRNAAYEALRALRVLP